jgi:hypothetical protein
VSADDHHCPHTDPDDPNSFGYGEADCFLGFSGSETTVYWQQSGDRSFEGTGMAFYGIDLGVALGFTTPLATLESLTTTSPINLGWDRVASSRGPRVARPSASIPAPETTSAA